VHKTDRQNVLYDVTGRHLNPDAQSCMKVILTAHIISRILSVATTIQMLIGKEHCSAKFNHTSVLCSSAFSESCFIEHSRMRKISLMCL